MAAETPETTQAPLSSTPEVLEQAAAPASVAQPTQTPTPAPAPENPSVATKPTEPDTLQPFIDKAHATIQDEVDAKALGLFLRAHIKTFREEWELWSDLAKDAYIHMMAAQLLQRKAAAIHIGLGHEFKLPDPCAQTDLMQSLQRTQAKPDKYHPAIDLPTQLRGITF